MDLLSDARNLFDEMLERNEVSFVTHIQGYSQALKYVEAIELFIRLHGECHELNPFAYLGLEAIDAGKSVYRCALETRYVIVPYVSVVLLDLSMKSGAIEDVRWVFDKIPKKDVNPWSFMIA
ncbi:hypothetical protein LguiB_012654 [Lonicera macranthoides]